MIDMGAKSKEADALEDARRVRRNAEIDHEVSILRQKAAKKRKASALELEKARKLELEAVELENKSNDLERTKVA
jgi:hypothetical protein